MRTVFNIFISLVSLFLVSCNSNTTNDDSRETARNGRFKLVVDESFRPIIDSQIEVFKSAYPKIQIEVVYATEAECYKAFDTDSATRLIITARGLSDTEFKYYKEKFETGVMFDKVALDAVAVILNPNAPDSLLTMDDLRDAMTGKSKKGYRAVFDGRKETSSARFLKDSILKSDTLPSFVSGLDSNQAVIDFVARNKTAIGFVGVSWVGDPNDPDQFSFLKKVKIASIQCQKKCPSYIYKKPYQANIAKKEYPLVRGLYYTVKNDYGGVATNFAKWLEQERGQLIFKSSYLVGTKLNVFIKEAEIER
jgi:phosphate transport system substrate-binding protein